MMKRLNYLFFFILLFLTPNIASAQLKVEFNVSVFKGDLKNTYVEIIQASNGKEGARYRVKKSGECQIKLKFDNLFLLRVEKKGYVSKVVEVNTDVPKDIQDDSGSFPVKKVFLKLYPIRKDVDVSFFDQAVEKIAYDEDMDLFVNDAEYIKAIRNTVDDIEAKLKQAPLINNDDLAVNDSKPLTEDRQLTEDKELTKDKNLTKDKPISEPKPRPIAKPKPLVKSKPIAKPKPRPIVKSKPVVKSKPLVKPKPIVKSKPSPKPKKEFPTGIRKETRNYNSRMNKERDFTVRTHPLPMEIKENPREVMVYELQYRLDEYNRLISLSDEAFARGKYAIAKNYLKKASLIKDLSLDYKAKLKKIVQFIQKDDDSRKKKNFDDFVTKGNNSYNEKQYALAKYYYKFAQALYPNDSFVNKRINDIIRGKK
ncbi:MAG: hypothetical protein N4A32_00940 [Marinifilaceae bacterium]|nr:hypothetical protein [Marinifilaceae bacterium]